MVNPLSTYRVYASTYHSFETLQNVNIPNEIHLVLAFARDYDTGGNSTQGVFNAYFDKAKVTPQVISEFKKNSLSPVKFFLSIGGRNQKYPFAVSPSQKNTWISNAVDSLTKLVNEYKFDGIDVYYQHINLDAGGQFVDAIRQVIARLKSEEVISEASITVSASVDDNYYYPLFQKSDKIIDTVVYQSHTEVNRITSVQGLIKVLDKLPYPKNKLFAGHSDVLPSDWSTVPLPVFLSGVPQLLESKVVCGISKWTVTSDYDPENPGLLAALANQLPSVPYVSMPNIGAPKIGGWGLR